MYDTNSNACPRLLPRLHLRHQEDDDYKGAGKEASKLTTASETNTTDDSYDSGNAESSPSHSILAEGSDEENLTRSLSKLGDGISLVEGS